MDETLIKNIVFDLGPADFHGEPSTTPSTSTSEISVMVPVDELVLGFGILNFRGNFLSFTYGLGEVLKHIIYE